MEQHCVGKQALLERWVAESIQKSALTLDALHQTTGISRTKLGRMRLAQSNITCDEAETVLRAVNCPSLAIFALTMLGENRVCTPQTLAFLNNLMSTLPALLDGLNDLGAQLNPKWAVGSAHHLGAMMVAHAERRREADLFQPDRR